jgi:hypothetical protein
MQFIIENKAAILGVALAISELLALIPSIKSNSIFELVFGWLKSSKK